MINVLYIAGAGRSGSTLLERILGQLEGSVAVGELRHLWREEPEGQRCGCGELLTRCEFWAAVLGRANIRADASGFRDIRQLQREVDRIRHVPRILYPALAGSDFKRRHAEYTSLLRDMYTAIQEMTSAKVIVDSSKDISTLYLLSHLNDVRVRVLHMIRDSRAVAYSWTREKERLYVVDRVTYMPRYSPQRSAGDWLYRNILTEMARARTAGYQRVLYEQLVVNPLETVQGIAGFMGLPEVDLGFITDSELQFTKFSHTIAGNPMRFEAGTVQLRFDSAWQKELGRADKAAVTALTWPLLRRYGYV